MAKFDDAKVGDRVWSSVYGWGVISKINHIKKYGISVGFTLKDCVMCGSYNFDGVNEFCEESYALHPTLFWNEFNIPTDDKDVRPFNLVRYLKERIEKTEFKPMSNNYYFCYDTLVNVIYIMSSGREEHYGTMYFTIKTGSVKEIHNTLSHYDISWNKLNDALRHIYKEDIYG